MKIEGTIPVPQSRKVCMKTKARMAQLTFPFFRGKIGVAKKATTSHNIAVFTARRCICTAHAACMMCDGENPNTKSTVKTTTADMDANCIETNSHILHLGEKQSSSSFRAAFHAAIKEHFGEITPRDRNVVMYMAIAFAGLGLLLLMDYQWATVGPVILPVFDWLCSFLR